MPPCRAYFISRSHKNDHQTGAYYISDFRETAAPLALFLLQKIPQLLYGVVGLFPLVFRFGFFPSGGAPGSALAVYRQGMALATSLADAPSRRYAPLSPHGRDLAGRELGPVSAAPRVLLSVARGSCDGFRSAAISRANALLFA